MKNKYLYIFSKGKVAKIKKADGEIVWETKLTINGIKYAGVANIQLDGDKLYIGGSGVLVCLNERDGSLVWSNSLKGWGYGYIAFANQNQAEAEMANAAAMAAAVTAST